MKFLLNENDIKDIINEVVYADRNKINDKNKTIGLTYSKEKRALSNANTADKLGTNEMDQDNANTIEVPLKGGFISYNITDIKGTEIMHYFKKKWASRQKVYIDVKKQDGNKDKYELQMDNNENELLFNNRTLSDEEAMKIIEDFKQCIIEKSEVNRKFNEDLYQEITMKIYTALTKNRPDKLKNKKI